MRFLPSFRITAFNFLLTVMAVTAAAESSASIAARLHGALKGLSTASVRSTGAAWSERRGGPAPIDGYRSRFRADFPDLSHVERGDDALRCADQIQSRHTVDDLELTFSLARLEGKCDEAPVMTWRRGDGPSASAALPQAAGANVTEVWAAGGNLVLGLTVTYDSAFYERRLAIFNLSSGGVDVFKADDPQDETLTVLLDGFASGEAAVRDGTLFLRSSGRTLAIQPATRSWWVLGPSTN